LHISATGHTVTGSGAADEQTYQAVAAGVRPNASKQLVFDMSQPTTTPALHCPTLMPQVMPLTARFLPSGASTRPSQSSSFGLVASQLCGCGWPAPKQPSAA